MSRDILKKTHDYSFFVMQDSRARYSCADILKDAPTVNNKPVTVLQVQNIAAFERGSVVIAEVVFDHDLETLINAKIKKS